MLNTFVVHVENKPGVLTRVASLFRQPLRSRSINSSTLNKTLKERFVLKEINETKHNSIKKKKKSILDYS